MAKIEKYGTNGEGIALCNGKVVFVPFALKDEEVQLEISKDNKSFSCAKLTQIISPSKNRVEPVCPYFAKCGGCQIMHAL